MGKKIDPSALMERVDRAAVSLEQTAPAARDIEAITAEILTLKQSAGDAILGIGQRLIEAKNMLSEGEWLIWLAESVDFSPRTAQRFMRLAREWSDATALSHLGATKALALLALPPEEREQFISEHHTVNGEDKTVIDMTSRELEQAIRERDEARLAAEAARADAKSAGESRAKMEADMALLKEQCRSAQDAVSAAQKELEELKAKPVEVAVMAVDQEQLAAARAEAAAEMQAKVDKAKAARDKAEEKRKEAEAALAEVRARLEEAGRAERKAAIDGDGDLAVFQLLFGQAQEIANKLHGLLLKAREREDGRQAAGMQKALAKLSELIQQAAESGPSAKSSAERSFTGKAAEV